MNRKASTAVFAIVVVAVFAYYWYVSSSPKVDQGVVVGKKAAGIQVDGLYQKSFVLSEHLGETVIVEFMTIWCPGCDAQIGIFKKLREEIDVSIVSINVDARPQFQPSEEWAADKGIDWFVGSSPEDGLTYEVSSVPTVIIIDKKGVIRYRGGPTTLPTLHSILTEYR